MSRTLKEQKINKSARKRSGIRDEHTTKFICKTCGEPQRLHISRSVAEKREDNDDHLSTREREVFMKHNNVSYEKGKLHEAFSNEIHGG